MLREAQVDARRLIDATEAALAGRRRALSTQRYSGSLQYLDIHDTGTLADLAQARADLAIIALPPKERGRRARGRRPHACRSALVISSGIDAEQAPS
jgi:acetyltransferase